MYVLSLLDDLLRLIQFNLLNQNPFKYTLKAFLITFFISVWLKIFCAQYDYVSQTMDQALNQKVWVFTVRYIFLI
ncbi:hypothetical protein SAMN04489762_2485 [Terribacillus saccharophilus]|uniref:Uncharacterized protein n=1 Tax=Terribacillus saccharophilus TaxID=361277 RepID=A0AAX2EH89_9BACI|nr:hypothetical protein SAMN04489762_2485 [Terribacillus saccharophilus]